MGAHLVKNLSGWLDRHPGSILLAGVTAAVAVNALAYLRDRKAAQRLKIPSCPPQMPVTLPRVSILLPAWNEAEHLADCMEAILGLSYPNTEVIVCAGGSDGSLDLLSAYQRPGVVIFEQIKGEGKQNALQRCFQRASGEIIFLTDADSILDDTSFLRTLLPIVEGREVAATGSRRPLDSQVQLPLVQFQSANHRLLEATLPDYVDTLFGINAAIHRTALEKAGAFTMPAIIGTDLSLGRQLMKAGYRICYTRDSHVRTDYQTSVSGYLRQQSRWFRNRFLYSIRDRKWREVLTLLRASLSAIFMLSVPICGGLGLRSLWMGWLAALTHLGLSQARLIGFLFSTQGEKPDLKKAAAIFPWMGLSWIAMARGLIESLMPALRGRW